MIIEKIGEGASIEEAYEAAKRLLNAPEDAELFREVIQNATKKLFGLKKEPAKVKVWYEVPDPKPVVAPKTVAPKPVTPVQEEKKAPEKKAPVQTAPVQTAKPAEKKAPVNTDKSADKKPAAKPTEEQVAPKANKPQKAAAPKAAPVQAPVRPEVKKVPVALASNDAAASYLTAIVKGMGIDTCTVTLENVEGTDEYIYTLDCGNEDGTLIGRRGETLDAIQYLLRLALNKGEEEGNRKVSVNVGNYREKRNDNLRSLAAKHARQVLKYGRNAVLEPMNPYERRIIHTAIQEIEGVTSHSVGADNNRRVVISLADGVQPTNPSRGGYNNRGFNNRGGKGGFQGKGGKGGFQGKGGKGGYQKREPYKPSVTREPRKDTAGSLYGKIEVPAKPEE